jgi:hypothetical protein
VLFPNALTSIPAYTSDAVVLLYLTGVCKYPPSIFVACANIFLNAPDTVTPLSLLYNLTSLIVIIFPEFFV